MNKAPVTRGLAVQQLNGGSVSVPRDPDSYRARRIRRAARRQLDELLAPEPCCRCCQQHVPQNKLLNGDPYADGHLNLGWAERDNAGRELAAAGWCP